jgi:hypothetical protein
MTTTKSSEFSPPASPTTATQPKKARPIPKTIEAAFSALLDGGAKNLTQASKVAGCSREYLSRFLSRRPDAVTLLQQRAARVLGVASTVAAARMAALIHAESEHVSFRAAEHVLGVSGISPAKDPQVNVSVSVRSGWLLDLREDTRSPLPTIEDSAAGGVIVDAEPIEPKADKV